MKALVLVVLCAISLPSEANRRVLSTPFNMHLRRNSDGDFFQTRIRVDLVNLSNVSQKVVVTIQDITMDQGVACKTEGESDTHYSNWTKHTIFKSTRYRNLKPPDVTREVNIPANGKGQAYYSYYCRADNQGPGIGGVPLTTTCSEDATLIAGYARPHELLLMDTTVIARFEIETTGVNPDRGALLASYAIILNIDGEMQELSREINGGRPF